VSRVRNVVDVIVSLTNAATDVVEKQFLRVDVTEIFPFLFTKLSPYYDRRWERFHSHALRELASAINLAQVVFTPRRGK
jgi:hypothetical protein